MNTRDILTMVGAFCLSFGETLRTLAPSATAYWIGLAMLAAGPILIGARSVISQPKKPKNDAKK